MGSARGIGDLFLPLALCACGSGREAARPTTLHLEVATDGADPLRSFAWDGGPETPLHRAPHALRIDFGTLGRTADTLLYLPFDEGVAGAAFTGAAELGLPTEHAGCAWTRGRFGSALELRSGSSRLVLHSGLDLLPEEGWTLQLRVRPELDWGETRILEIPGKLEITTTSGFHPRILVATDPVFEVHFPGPLPQGEWSSFGVALSVEPLPQVRAVLNGEARGWVVERARLPGDDRTLLIGGELPHGRTFRGAVDELRLRAHPASSAELIGQAERACPPGLHSLELRKDSGAERLELWSGFQAGATVASEAALGRGELHHAVVRDGRLRWVPAQWTELDPEARPMARTTHPTVFVGAHRALVFGGETRDTHVAKMVNTADTWLFHTDTARWERVETARAPSPRCHQSAAYSPDHGLVLLVGGFRNDAGDYQVHDDAWVYDVPGRAWRALEPEGYPRRPTADNCLLYSPGRRAFLHIAADGAALWSPDEDRWTRLPTPRVQDPRGAELPGPLFGPSITAGLDPRTGKVLLFGGVDAAGEERGFHARTYEYDLEAGTLTLVESPLAPSPRVRPGFAYDSRRGAFVLFGGVREDDSPREGDLWRYLPARRAWEPIEAANPPGPRGGYFGMAYDPELDACFLLCGRQARERFLDEAWQLRLDERAVGRATYGFARATLPSRPLWTIQAVEPGDARVAARFRWSVEEGRWLPWEDSLAALPAEARAVLVELSLHPGSQGEVPEVLSFGFEARG